jgi:hypothetical protein
MAKIIERLRETDEKQTPLMLRLDHLRELKQEVIMGNQQIIKSEFPKLIIFSIAKNII